jgi:hypothetical protein
MQRNGDLSGIGSFRALGPDIGIPPSYAHKDVFSEDLGAPAIY